MADFTIKRNDRLPPIESTLSPSAVDLTGATVKFIMATYSGTVKVNSTAVVVQATAPPKVRYEWAAVDTDTVGDYRAEWEATFADGKKETFPNGGYLIISVVADLA